jgi:flagellar hook-basal body complex protein FliE
MPIDKVNPAAAAGAYANIQKTGAMPGVEADGKASFGDTIRNLASSAIDSLKQSERASAAAVTGKAELTDVVEAVTRAEMTIQTVVAMRDRLLSSYQEIMRMPI